MSSASDPTLNTVDNSASVPLPQVPSETVSSHEELGSLLENLERVSSSGVVLPPVFDTETDRRLIELRLGMAASLFAALQCKHAATAGHALRVALTTSAWAKHLGLEPGERGLIEVAALMHDIGVIGVPDHILLKPSSLDSDETTLMAEARLHSLEILRHSCSSEDILDIVEHIPAWYNGQRQGFQRSGKELPLGSRMIAIVEAFDAMATDHVYRRAMSQERATNELFDFADTQFDGELVGNFVELTNSNHHQLHQEVARRWLNSLDTELVNSHWYLNCVPSPAEPFAADPLFQKKLLQNMYDAVVFIDAGGRVTQWNRGAERLTGIAGNSVMQRQWHPEMLGLTDSNGNTVGEHDCPISAAIRSGVQSLKRLQLWGRRNEPITVDTHTIPVIARDGTSLGAILLFHDASSESSLEKRCQNLHEKATRDPLTNLANRAEFDRALELFVRAHEECGMPCSLIIGDLDHFKLVNDTWGHQAGDDVLRAVSKVLRGACHPGDLVARYGGEEFVLLCADCDNATATRRAELTRADIERIQHVRMQGGTVGISFGVTEIQPGDTPETMLRRADRALLMAKGQGRNCVVQLGTGSAPKSSIHKLDTKIKLREPRSDLLIEKIFSCRVPARIAVEKLWGFVADHQAKIVHSHGDHVQLEITERHPSRLRRLTDRSVVLKVELRFKEERPQPTSSNQISMPITQTKIRVRISLTKTRDRRRKNLMVRANDLLLSLRSYLMVCAEEEPSGKTLQRAKQWLVPWLGKNR